MPTVPQWSRKPQALQPRRASASTPFWSSAALFFLPPLWVMLMTSFKSMDGDPRRATSCRWPRSFTLDAWIKAWSFACTGLDCDGISVGFWNSVRILVPVGHPLDRARRAEPAMRCPSGACAAQNLLFAILLVGAFIPYQVFLYPLVRVFSLVGIYDSLPGIVVVHVIFGLPTDDAAVPQLLRSLPHRTVQGRAGRRRRLLAIFLHVMLPMSTPMHRRRDHPAGHRHLERLHPRPRRSRAARICR